jgi:hypothetical protein
MRLQCFSQLLTSKSSISDLNWSFDDQFQGISLLSSLNVLNGIAAAVMLKEAVIRKKGVSNGREG